MIYNYYISQKCIIIKSNNKRILYKNIFCEKTQKHGKNRQKKIYTIIALVVTTFGLTLGFAAFSNVLNISSNATVKPDSSTFGVEFSTISSAVSAGTISGIHSDGASNGTATLSSTSVTGLQANFVNPGESVTFTFYAHNTGEYDSYLRNITYSNVDGETSPKVCEGASGTKSSLVTAACDDITLTVNVGELSTTETKSLTKHKLAKDAYETITIKITYWSTGDRADGQFTVEFGDISLEYSSAYATPTNEISFTIDGTSYTAGDGMTWAEWIASSYNPGNFSINSSGYIITSNGWYVQNSEYYNVDLNEPIESNYSYVTSSSASPN